ncbi:MAG: FHA domain-containing protein [Thermoplasmatota archaeon]
MSGATLGDDKEALAGLLKALANPRRLALLEFLTEPRAIDEVAQTLGLVRQTAQRHVDRLVAAGLVERVRSRRGQGPSNHFRVSPQRLFVLHEQLGRACGVELEPSDGPQAERAVTTPLATGTPLPKEPRVAPVLAIVHGMRVGTVVPLIGEGPWAIGRDPTSALCIDYDPFASTRHAEVARSDDGGFEVVDLYSSNGTTVDWQPLMRGGRRPLSSGAVIKAGRSLLVFRLPV